MYSTEQRKLAIETCIKFDLSAAGTAAETVRGCGGNLGTRVTCNSLRTSTAA